MSWFEDSDLNPLADLDPLHSIKRDLDPLHDLKNSFCVEKQRKEEEEEKRRREKRDEK